MNSLKPKEGTTDDADNAQKGSNAADDSVKDTDIGVVGSEDGSALTTKPVLNKGGVGFA